jgi:hypothetical protein
LRICVKDPCLIFLCFAACVSFVVGIIFDGNLQSLAGDYGYDDIEARALSVHSAGILEALQQVYEVPALVAELRAGKR